MRKDTTKKFLMRENRYANRMISFEMHKFLSRKKKRIACDMIDFINVFGIKSTHLNMKNILGSGDKTRERVSKNSKIVEFNMVYCEEGSFTMGHSDVKSNQPRPETIEHSFLLGETEVTQELYELVMDKNPSEFKDTSKYPNAPKHPVENVTWYESIEFCNALSKLKGLQECYIEKADVQYKWGCDFSKNGFRLPREKEWEYAAKAGTNNRWAGIDDESKLGEYAWYGEDESKGTHPVATKKPNEWGFYDMTGNVHEWCGDKFENSKNKDIRGGCYFDYYYPNLRNSYRTNFTPSSRDHSVGFRICRTI